MPKKDDYSIVINGKDEPNVIIQKTDVSVVPMDEVTEEFAFHEGEGDRSYTYWWKEHERFFTE